MVKQTVNDGMSLNSHLHESGGWSRSQSPITEAHPHLPIHEQKILELTNKITELLIGEVPIRCQDVAVYFSMEEWEYLEEHKDLYKDVKMENHQPPISQDYPSENSDGNFMLSPTYTVEEDIVQHSSGEKLTTLHLQPGYNSLDKKPYSCSEYGKCLTDRANCIIHEKSHLMEKQFPCLQYGNSKLRDHLTIHSEEKTISNSECEKYFTRKLNLVTNEKSHTGEKPYYCSECGKCFEHKSVLVNHERIHTGEKTKTFSCSQCEKCFTQKSKFITHQRIHTGEKPYSCTVCGKYFRDKSNITRHLKIHTGERPHTCSECGKSFRDKPDFVKHQRIHTGEKPYTCSECGKRFTEKSSLVKHQRIHTGKKP
ncbi:hypothetical protein GDO78_021609 [Eleutherodactylus coqui]|uniref:Uncharacterized protein n=1 Tax=Eleutherodactylus coqui TaxID=57060 RepID=A0A8J6BA86_ELECQ|nr:hypothetical protein GDO78_021609 [Eleutherodactylus coqui]